MKLSHFMICSLAVSVSLFSAGSSSFADDGAWGDITPLEISWIGDSALLDLQHEDADPFKGSATLTVTNTGDQPWGDFHFGFYDPIGGQDISGLAFLDASMEGIDPSSTQSPMTWVIDNVVVGATMDLYFYSDPVQPGETATFSVYTANTGHLPWFGLQVYPTPVPEPATMGLVCVGAIALLIKRRR